MEKMIRRITCGKFDAHMLSLKNLSLKKSRNVLAREDASGDSGSVFEVFQ